MTRIVAAVHRYKRPPRKRKAVVIAGPAVVRKGHAKPAAHPTPELTNGDRKPLPARHE